MEGQNSERPLSSNSLSKFPVVPPIMESAHPSTSSLSEVVEDTDKLSAPVKSGVTTNPLPKSNGLVIKFNIQEKELKEVVTEVKKKLRLLLTIEVSLFERADNSDDFTYLKEASRYGERGPKRLAVYDAFADAEATEVFHRVWYHNFPLEFTKNKQVFNNMKDIMIVLWNGTDMSQKLIDKIIITKLYEQIWGFLSHEKFKPEALTNQNTKFLLKGCMGILNNCVQNYDCRDLFRQCQAIDILLALKDSQDNTVAMKVLMLLSYLVTEEENEKIHSHDNHFEFFVKILKSTLENDDHHSNRYGYSSLEVIESLNRLASNDKNKERIVRSNVLPYYVQMLDHKKFSAKEMSSAARGIWTLAFKCSSEIASEPGCIEALQNLTKTSEDKDVIKQARGALWILAGKGAFEKSSLPSWPATTTGAPSGSNSSTTPVAPPPPPQVFTTSGPPPPPPIHAGFPVSKKSPPNEDAPHIFVSYSWGNKPMVLRIVEKLKQEGFKVWMDVEDMSGSILEAMALAVEKADVVLVCFSQKYKESPNCRTEAEYTFRQRKPIVPLRMQFRYAADGWLGALIGNQLFFDFSKDEKFDTSVEGVMRELGNRGRLIPIEDKDVTDMPISPVVAVPTSASPKVTLLSSSHGVKDWVMEDVKKWLDKLEISNVSPSLYLLTGGLLLELKFVCMDAPEFFYSSLKQDFGLSIIDALKFSQALKQLK